MRESPQFYLPYNLSLVNESVCDSIVETINQAPKGQRMDMRDIMKAHRNEKDQVIMNSTWSLEFDGVIEFSNNGYKAVDVPDETA